MKSGTIKQKSLIEYYNFSKAEQKKYPVITGILKQLTPKRIEKEIKEIQQIKLPPELQKWVEEYEKVGERISTIWLLTYKIIQITSFIDDRKEYQNAKFLLTMFIILLDDVVDKIQNKKLMNEFLKISLEKENDINLNFFSAKDKEYLKFSIYIWNSIYKLIKKYPLYEEFKDIFFFDIRQIFNSMNFAFLINKNPCLINITEYSAYFSCSMQAMAYIMLDLMRSPKFVIKELGNIREFTWEAQNMLRVGNWISTWEREIRQGDYTSGIFAYSINSGLITIDGLKKKNSADIINKIKASKAEKKFLEKWEEYYNKTDKLSVNIRFFNTKNFLLQLKQIMIFHLTIRNI